MKGTDPLAVIVFFGVLAMMLCALSGAIFIGRIAMEAWR